MNQLIYRASFYFYFRGSYTIITHKNNIINQLTPNTPVIWSRAPPFAVNPTVRLLYSTIMDEIPGAAPQKPHSPGGRISDSLFLSILQLTNAAIPASPPIVHHLPA